MRKTIKLLTTVVIALLTSSIAFSSLAATQFPDAVLVDFKIGKTTSIAEFKGKVLYIDFWASWCVPCKKSFPFMNEISKNYPDNQFQVIAINMDENKSDAEVFLQNYPANFTVFTNPGNKLAKTLQLPGLPMAFIINAQGEIMAKHAGFNNSKKAKKIQQLNLLMEQK